MSQYIEVKNYSGLGKIGISKKVLESIAVKAISNVKGVTLSKKESLIFQVVKPVKATVSRSGEANIKVAVNVTEGSKVKDICTNIQQEISQAVKIMCETVPLSVTVTVESVG